MKKIVIGALLLAVLGVASFTGTRAFFSDTETSTGNVFAAGSMDLRVGIDSASKSFVPQNLNNRTMFDFKGLMPGDVDSGFFKLESSQDAWVCMAADIAEENKSMKHNIELATWVENTPDGKVGTAEVGTLEAYTLGQYDQAGWVAVQDKSVNGTPLSADEQYEQGFAYCFGEFARNDDGSLVVEKSMPVCNGASVPNGAQGGIVKGEIRFHAVQARNNPDFQCSGLNPAVPASAGEITSVTAEYTSVAGEYSGVYVGFSEADVVDATAIELRLNLSGGTSTSTLSTFAQAPVLNSVNTIANHGTGGTVIVTGSRTSSSWAPQTAPIPAIPSGVTVESVEVLITLGDGTVLSQTLDEASITNQTLGDSIFN